MERNDKQPAKMEWSAPLLTVINIGKTWGGLSPSTVEDTLADVHS